MRYNQLILKIGVSSYLMFIHFQLERATDGIIKNIK